MTKDTGFASGFQLVNKMRCPNGVLLRFRTQLNCRTLARPTSRSFPRHNPRKNEATLSDHWLPSTARQQSHFYHMLGHTRLCSAMLLIRLQDEELPYNGKSKIFLQMWIFQRGLSNCQWTITFDCLSSLISAFTGRGNV